MPVRRRLASSKQLTFQDHKVHAYFLTSLSKLVSILVYHMGPMLRLMTYSSLQLFGNYSIIIIIVSEAVKFSRVVTSTARNIQWQIIQTYVFKRLTRKLALLQRKYKLYKFQKHNKITILVDVDKPNVNTAVRSRRNCSIFISKCLLTRILPPCAISSLG